VLIFTLLATLKMTTHPGKIYFPSTKLARITIERYRMTRSYLHTYYNSYLSYGLHIYFYTASKSKRVDQIQYWTKPNTITFLYFSPFSPLLFTRQITNQFSLPFPAQRAGSPTSPQLHRRTTLHRSDATAFKIPAATERIELPHLARPPVLLSVRLRP
jgi:capsule polysaccharide export protein KpsC/LpsZ